MEARGLYPGVLDVVGRLVLEPLFGVRYLSVAGWLPDFWSWSDERRWAWRQKRLHDVLAHARVHVPFYRQLLGSAGTVELAALPVVDKARIRPDFDSFASDGWRQMPHVQKSTGGTSGDPWAYPLDKRAWEQIYGAALYFYGWTGYRYGERVVLLGTPTSLGLDQQGLKTRMRYRIERTVTRFAGSRIDPDASLSRARQAGAQCAALWYCHAGTIAAMADAVLVSGVTVHSPRAIVTTAEALQPAWRERIGEAFGTPVWDQYGCNDGGIMTQTCELERFHIAENVSLVEILDDDGRPCPSGAEGNVTVTNLHAKALPFLRYQTGDRAVSGEGPCPCGRPGATLERVSGRQGDRLRLPDGSTLSALTFGRIFKNSRGVRRWQVVQTGPSQIKLRLETEPSFFDDREEADRIVDGVRVICGEAIHVQLTTDEPIERSPGGKLKVVVRDIAAEEGASS